MSDNTQTQNSDILLMLASTPLNPHIIADISNTLIESITQSNSLAIQQALALIAHYQSQKGYVAYLLQIINCNMKNIHIKIKELLVRAALTQLKVYVRKQWKSYQNQQGMCQEDAQFLIGSFVRTSYNISSVAEARIQVKYMRLLKDVIEITCSLSIDIFPQVIEAIQLALCSEQSIHILPAYLNIVLGFINNQSTMMSDVFSEKCIRMLRMIHPLLRQFTHRGEQRIHQLYDKLAQTQFQDQQFVREYELFKRKYQQILYLNIKVLYKGLFLKDIDDVRDIIYEWILVALNRIEYVDPTFTRQADERHHQPDTGLRGTDQFNYFHGKKWAIKLVRASMERLFMYRGRRSEAGMSTMKFYQLNLPLIVQVFQNIWKHQWPSTIKCELLRAIDRLVQSQPFRLFKEYEQVMKYFQEHLLPPMIDLTFEKEVMQESPVQFMARERILECKSSIFDFRSCRLMAATVWLSITTMEYRYNKECKDPRMLRNGLLLIYTWLLNVDLNNLNFRDIGCFLLIKLKDNVKKVVQYQQPLKILINKTIKQNLQISNGNTHFMLLVRAFQLAHQYAIHLQQDTMAMTRLRFASILDSIDLNREIRYDSLIILAKGSKAVQQIIEKESRNQIEIDTEELKTFICKLFCLIQLTSNQQFIFAVSGIMKASMKKLKDYYHQIAQFLQDWFITYMEKDLYSFKNDPAKAYRENYVSIAKETLGIYETILCYTEEGNDETTRVITNELIKILTYLFLQTQFDSFMQEEGLSFLKTYLHHFKKGDVLDPIIKLCRIMVLKMAGLPKAIQSALKESQSHTAPNSDEWKQLQIYINCFPTRTYGFNCFVGAVRAFIKHIDYGQSIRSIPQISDSILNEQTNNTEYLIYLASRFYGSANPSEYADTCNGKCFSMLMLIHYYEHHQRSDCSRRIHQSVNEFTFMLIYQTQREYSIKRRYAKYNSQLFCLWMHQLQDNFINYFNGIQYNQLQQFISSVLVSDSKYGLQEIRYYEQDMRCVYGISTLLRTALRSQNLWQLLPVSKWTEIISAAINFGYRSTQDYVNDTEESIGFEDNNDDEEEEEEEDQDVVVQTIKQARHRSTFNNAAKDSIDQYMEKIKALQEDEEQYEDDFDEDDYSIESDNCWQYEESEDCPLATPLQDLKNDGIYLLTALYDLYSANESLYFRIIEEELLREKMYAILETNHCFTDQSRSYLKVLCGETDWEEQN